MRRRIAWESKVTGFTDHGEWQDWDADTMESIAKKKNWEFPMINHWVEEESLTPYQQAAIDCAGTLSILILKPGLGKGELLSPSGEPGDSDAVVELYRP